MAIIVKGNYDLVSRYANGRVTTKYNGKKHQVYFKLSCDDYSVKSCIELAKTSSNVVMVDYEGLVQSPNFLELTEPQGVYVGVRIDVSLDVTEDDIIRLMNSIPYGVTPILRVPEDYKNIKFLYDMCHKYSRIRFCGGTLFNLMGCKFGCCGADILKEMGIKFPEDDLLHEGCCCALEIVDDVNLEFEVGAVKAPRKVSEPKEKKQKATAVKKTSATSFKGLLSFDDDDDDL